jgi:putative ABC transport system permease protein
MRLRRAALTLRRNPAFTLTALAMISLGLGTVTALFSVVDKVLLEPLPYPDPSRLVQLITTSPIGRQTLASIPQYIFWRDTTKSFESMAASDIDGPDVNLTEGDYRLSLKTARVSADYFRLLGAEMALGRTFTATEDSPGGAPGRNNVVVIGDALRRHFHADATLIGRTILLDNLPHKIVGMLAPGIHLESPAAIWLPLCADPRSVDHIARVRVVARLRPDISLETARNEVRDSLPGFLKIYPPFTKSEAPMLFREEFTALPLRDAVVGDVKPALYLLMGAVGFVLAISCANTTTVLLSRAARRTREIAVMMALGAQRKQILLQLLTEGVLLTLIAGIASLLLGHLAVRGLLALSPVDLPRIGADGSAITLDAKAFLFTVCLSALIGILCALVPAVNLSRTGISVLVKESASQSGMTFRRNPWRSILMIAEISLSLILLAGAALMIRTFVARRAVSRGFDEQNVVTMEMSLNNPRFDETTLVAQLVDQAEHTIASIPGVAAVAATSALPLAPSLPMPFTILRNDHVMLGRYDGTATWRSVSPRYFKTFQIRLLRGRTFTSADNANAARVVLINRAMMKQFWPYVDFNPIGDFIWIGKGLAGDQPRQIVGVVADVRDAGLDREPSMYIPVAQVSSWMNARNNRLAPLVWAIRADGTRPLPVSRIQRDLAGLSGGQPVLRPRTMHEVIAPSSARNQFYMTLLTVFAGIALVLTAAGLYGLVSYSVAQRSRELAIRMALGATAFDVQELVVKQALRLAFWGTLVGIPLALALVRITISLLFGVQTWDPLMLALVAAVLGAVSVFAAYVPAVRAGRVNPATALRSEN